MQDPKLEQEIVDKLIKTLQIPNPSKGEASRHEILFPAHVIGLLTVKLWQHGLLSYMQAVMSNCIKAIEDRANVISSYFFVLSLVLRNQGFCIAVT